MLCQGIPRHVPLGATHRRQEPYHLHNWSLFILKIINNIISVRIVEAKNSVITIYSINKINHNREILAVVIIPVNYPISNNLPALKTLKTSLVLVCSLILPTIVFWYTSIKVLTVQYNRNDSRFRSSKNWQHHPLQNIHYFDFFLYLDFSTFLIYRHIKDIKFHPLFLKITILPLSRPSI